MTQRRNQILDAAAELIAEQGFVQTSVNEVIAHAGLSGKSHFYHYFKSKESLGHEVVARQFDVLAERGVTILRDASTAPLARLDRFIDSVVTLQSESGARLTSPFGVLATGLADLDESFRLRIAQLFRSWTEEISALLTGALDQLEPGVEPKRLARFIVATLEGATTMARLKHDVALMHGVADDLKSYIAGHLRKSAKR